MAEDFVKVDTRELAAFGKVLKQVDRPAWKAMNKAVRDIAKPIAQEVSRAAESIPSSGESARQKQPSLRQGIAKAVQVKASSTNTKSGAYARIRVSGTKFMQASGRNNPRLPRYMEGLTRRPWRHPVYADKGADRGKWQGPWSVQKSHPFMLPTALKHKDQVRDKIAQAYLDTVKQEIKKGTKLT